jgi:hypothetical protein
MRPHTMARRCTPGSVPSRPAPAAAPLRVTSLTLRGHRAEIGDRGR